MAGHPGAQSWGACQRCAQRAPMTCTKPSLMPNSTKKYGKLGGMLPRRPCGRGDRVCARQPHPMQRTRTRVPTSSCLGTRVNEALGVVLRPLAGGVVDGLLKVHGRLGSGCTGVCVGAGRGGRASGSARCWGRSPSQACTFTRGQTHCGRARTRPPTPRTQPLAHSPSGGTGMHSTTAWLRGSPSRIAVSINTTSLP